FYILSVTSAVYAACIPSTTSTDDLQSLFQKGGVNYILSLCPNQTYNLTQILNYTAAGQEISTEGYPTDVSRATLLVGGFNISTAVQAQNNGLDGCKLRNVQVNGNRGDDPIYQGGGGLIEFGGDTNGQLVEYVHSFDPRGWSCLHIAEGPFTCTNVTIQNNDIGPCGSEFFQMWSDGISLSCQSSLVQNNVITDATDGGIVVFGAPFSTIRNNTIRVKTKTLLGGINMVDVLPWRPPGNYSGVHVTDNSIHGGFATGYGNATLGTNNASSVIKIGIAVGPRTWFDDQFGNNVSTGGVIENNVLQGAFSFGIAVSSAKSFTLQNNTFINNISFVGSYGVNCTTGASTPHPPTALLFDPSNTENITIIPGSSTTSGDNLDFVNGKAEGLTCFVHPPTDEFAWPYGDGGVNAGATETTGGGSTGSTSGKGTGPSSTGSNSGSTS
ncbi:hypothetical protein TREMEDRAFT_14833, partial [Tremella mesenterica DSM 1558]|uniref:uncharacterized protein n=1 Tax=Tremella mesenterica (strain ATCC 24925 / CBS 8224 / DSM 1558 / NBRC 9311 / NRRL Y-6157 / RJB 2259-6 / UBC 559-6) TaxID=578456 RepID=UPI0003F49309